MAPTGDLAPPAQLDHTALEGPLRVDVLQTPIPQQDQLLQLHAFAMLGIMVPMEGLVPPAQLDHTALEGPLRADVLQTPIPQQDQLLQQHVFAMLDIMVPTGELAPPAQLDHTALGGTLKVCVLLAVTLLLLEPAHLLFALPVQLGAIPPLLDPVLALHALLEHSQQMLGPAWLQHAVRAHKIVHLDRGL